MYVITWIWSLLQALGHILLFYFFNTNSVCPASQRPASPSYKWSGISSNTERTQSMHPVPHMAKSLKLKFSRVIPSLQFCRQKNPSTFPENPIIGKYRLSPLNPKTREIAYPNLPAPPPPPSTPEDSFVKRGVSNKIASVGCGCGSSQCIEHSSFEDCSSESIEPRYVINYVPKPRRKTYGETSTRKKDSRKKENESGWFSSEEEETEETESPQSSSMTFSNNSSYDFNQAIESRTEKSDTDQCRPMKNKKGNVKKIRKLKRHVSFSKPKIVKNESRVKVLAQRSGTPYTVEEKVKDSVAVVKKSMDPYEDFKMSMLEMILEKQMFEDNDLEQLLQCFLSLNSRQYHVVIVEAFTEIWKALFADHILL
ncbi:putative Ovate family protein 8 [Tripterygium wilfordii]|uniref:Transcription repressor n=1 Tax=Tripterygium wilfordii TaxID=458696 RepID=A0A7J7DL59_TRIWF|nr:transcription repressor OFP7-like [Tripterygium wilfordii]KAF5747102.1 putative Ovate family protein 8 [Tripterygium wilfordii]